MVKINLYETITKYHEIELDIDEKEFESKYYSAVNELMDKAEKIPEVYTASGLAYDIKNICNLEEDKCKFSEDYSGEAEYSFEFDY